MQAPAPQSLDVSQYAIARMERAHLVQVLWIERESYTNPWPEEAFVHEIESNPVGRPLVATTLVPPVEVVGYVVTWVVFENLHVQNVAVHPAHRRGGVARKLLDRAFEDALDHKAEVALLEVRRSNTAAQELYRSLGFVDDGVREGYYTLPVEDALLFRRELSRSRPRSSARGR